MTSDHVTGSGRLGASVLVCDVGGVLLTDGLHRVLVQAATSVGREPAAVLQLYRSSGLRDQLFTGAVSTHEFWSSLEVLVGTGCYLPSDPDAAVIARCQPLPGLSSVRPVLDRLWLATNHRHEWVLPALRAAGFVMDPERVVSSSLLGTCKPEISFYRHVQSRLPSPHGRVVYVDDQEANLKVPKGLGWSTVRFIEGGGALAAALEMLS